MGPGLRIHPVTAPLGAAGRPSENCAHAGATLGVQNPMPGQRLKDMPMHRLEQLPVEKPGNSLRAERANLHERAIATLISQPGISGKPTKATQYQ
jgi:hypothetical protein